MIGAQGTRLTQITEEVLLANRLDRGDLRIDRERVDLARARPATRVETMREDAPESISLTASGRTAPPRRRRPRPDRAGARQPDRQRGQVLARRRRGRSSARRRPPRACGSRSPTRESGSRRPSSEAVFEKFYRGDPQHRAVPERHGPRPLHLPRARAADGRHDRRPLPAPAQARRSASSCREPDPVRRTAEGPDDGEPWLVRRCGSTVARVC